MEESDVVRVGEPPFLGFDLPKQLLIRTEFHHPQEHHQLF